MIAGYDIISGTAASNGAFLILLLHPWDERPGKDLHALTIVAKVAAATRGLPEAIVVPFNPPALPGFGSVSGFSMMLQARGGQSAEELAAVAGQFMAAAQQRPEIGRITTTFSASTPNYRLEVDREKVKKLGVPVNEVFTTLQTFLGGFQVNDFTRFGRNYKVTMQAESEFRQEVRDLGLLFVRNEQGAMVPLDTLTTAVPSSGARFLQRFNLYRTAAFSGSPAPGASSGDALRALEEVAADLPADYGFEWSGQSRQEVEAGNAAAIVLGLSIVVVFLFLAALYESWAVPFAVLLATPFGFLGALVAIKLGGLAFNVYGQIGLVTLIGLVGEERDPDRRVREAQSREGDAARRGGARGRAAAAAADPDDFLRLHHGRRAADDRVRGGRRVQGLGRRHGVRRHDRRHHPDDARRAGVLRADPGPRRACGRRAGDGGARAARDDRFGCAYVRCPSRGVVLLLAAAIGALAGGCAIGPDYERPADVMPADAYRGVLQAQQAESFADVGWAVTFADPELVELIRTAIENNLDLQIAAARVEEFRGLAKVERSRLGPQVSGTATTAPNPQSDEDASYAAGFGLSWELDFFGKLRRASESARAQLLASEDSARAVMTLLVADVATTWFLLRELDEEVQIISDTIKSQQESLALVQSLNRSGVASGTEEQQAVGQLATTRAQLPVAQRNREQAENRLRFLLGYPPDRIPRIQSPRTFPVPAEIPVGLPAALLTRRPDVRQAEKELHAATALVGVALASRFPYLNIGVTAFFGLVSPELSALLSSDDPSQELFAVGPFIDAPIWQSGAGTGNVAAARAQALQAELRYRRSVLQALREVSDALIGTDKVRELIAQNEIRVAATGEVLRLQRMRYRGGVVSYLEVLDAERQFFDAEIELARSRFGQLGAYVELYRALGGGWSEEEVQRAIEAAAAAAKEIG